MNRKAKKWWVLFSAIICAISVLCFASCGNKSDTDDVYHKTIMLYLCGSDLESRFGSATDNLKELMESDIPEDTAIIVQTGGAKKWHDYNIKSDEIGRYRVTNDGLMFLEKQPIVSMGDKDTLYNFLDYGRENYPAEKTGVVFWNHGGGGLSGVCFDEIYNYDSLTIDELDYAFSKVRENMDKNFEMIGFDVCLMANMETADIVSKYADYMIASEETEPLGGWDYKDLVAGFGSDAGYRMLLSSYEEKCKRLGSDLYTLSYIDMEKYKNLAPHIDQLMTALNNIEYLKTATDSVINSMAFGCQYPHTGSNIIDLADFADGLNFPDIREKINDCIVKINSPSRDDASGLAIFFPRMFTPVMIEKYSLLPVNEKYKSFVKDNFSFITEQNIDFSDLGSDAGGEVHVEIMEDSKKYVRDVKYKIYRMIDKGELHEEVHCLGYDSDVEFDGNLGYTTSFKGRWATWNGEFITCTSIGETDDCELFVTPVKLNGIRGDVIFSYKKSDESFEMQGFNKLYENGAYDRTIEIKPDDKITLLQDKRVDSYDVTLVEGKTFTVKEGEGLKVEKLPEGYFQSYIIVTDVFNFKYRTCSAVSYWNGEKMEIKYFSTGADGDD